MIAGLALVLCLGFLFYEAEQREQPSTPKTAPIQGPR